MSILKEIAKDIDDCVAQKEDIEKNLRTLKLKQVEVNEKIESKKNKKENANEGRIKSVVEATNKKPVSILDRLGPKALEDHQKVDSWNSDRFLKVRQAQSEEQKSRDKRFLTNYVKNTLATFEKEISQDSVKLEKVRAAEKALEYKYSEDYLLERESKEIVSSLEKNEVDLEDVVKKIQELKEKLKQQKQLDREAMFTSFYKTNAKPSVYFRPVKIDDWVTEKFGIKVAEEKIRENSESPEKTKKTSRHAKQSEEEEERELKKRRVEDDDVIVIERPAAKNDDDEVQIIEVRSTKNDYDLGFSIRVGEEGRTISLK